VFKLKIMKQLLVIPLMLIGLLGTSQNGFRIPDDEHAIFSVYADYADSKVNGYGPNIGAEFGYSGFVEAKVGFETFPQLYGGYIDVHGAIGFKMVHGLWEQWNYYAGIRAIVVWRGGEGAWRAQPGIEGQITYDLNDWFGIGLRGTYDKRYDMEIFDWPVKNVASAYLIIIFKLKRQ
jgi:hypothetical protein